MAIENRMINYNTNIFNKIKYDKFNIRKFKLIMEIFPILKFE